LTPTHSARYYQSVCRQGRSPDVTQLLAITPAHPPRTRETGLNRPSDWVANSEQTKQLPGPRGRMSEGSELVSVSLCYRYRGRQSWRSQPRTSDAHATARRDRECSRYAENDRDISRIEIFRKTFFHKVSNFYHFKDDKYSNAITVGVKPSRHMGFSVRIRA
jgi:hypothetical protein